MSSRGILKDTTRYVAGTLLAQVLGVATSILTRRLLTPEMMGIWATFLIVLNYALFAQMGVFTAVEVRIPYLRGKGDAAEIATIRDVAFTVAVILSILLGIVLFGASFFLKAIVPDYAILGIRVTALIVIATLFYNLYISMLRADKRFNILSNSIVFNSAAMLIFTGLFAKFWQLKGIYVAAFLATFLSWIYAKSFSKYKLAFHFELSKYMDLVKMGGPILISGIVYTFLLSIDKIMIIKMIGAKELGYYSIAALAFTYANTFPKLFSFVLFPTVQEAFGKAGSKGHIVRYVMEPTIIMAYLFPPLLAAAYFLLPALVHWMLPKYILGIESMRMLLVGCFFISLASLAQSFVLSLNRQMALIPITILAVFLGCILNFFAIKAGYGILGVAMATSVAYFAYFIIVFQYIFKHSEGPKRVGEFYANILSPAVFSMFSIALIEFFLRIQNYFLRMLTEAGAFYLLYAPLLWYLNKRTNVLTKIWNSFFRYQNKIIPEKVSLEEGVEI